MSDNCCTGCDVEPGYTHWDNCPHHPAFSQPVYEPPKDPGTPHTYNAGEQELTSYFEYKILSQTQLQSEFITSSEPAMNRLAKQGWRLVSTTMPSLGQDVTFYFERWHDEHD